ncbi:MAG: hypothetical protein AAF633_28505 [Chloroflexota bacterium]
MFESPSINILLVLPAVIVAVWGLIVMVIDIVTPDEDPNWMPILTVVGLIAALVFNFINWSNLQF